MISSTSHQWNVSVCELTAVNKNCLQNVGVSEYLQLVKILCGGLVDDQHPSQHPPPLAPRHQSIYVLIQPRLDFKERVIVPNQNQTAKSELLVTVKGSERHIIPSIYAQTIFSCVSHIQCCNKLRRMRTHQNMQKK